MTGIDPVVAGIVIGTAALLGLAVGSFLNVVIWRVPRKQSIVRPPSACPDCGHRIRSRDNIPVLSWLVLRGRCRDCDSPISPRYPIVEAATGLAFAAVAARLSAEPALLVALPAFLYLAAIGIALTMIDIDTHRLPNAIVYPAYPVSLVLLGAASVLSGDGGAFVRALLGGVALFLFYFILAIAVPRGMGFGDVKLAGVLGLHLGWLGWDALVVGAFAAFVLGGLYSVVLLARGRAGRKSGIPFGPWMAAGAGVGIIFGEQVAGGYLALVGFE